MARDAYRALPHRVATPCATTAPQRARHVRLATLTVSQETPLTAIVAAKATAAASVHLPSASPHAAALAVEADSVAAVHEAVGAADAALAAAGRL